MKSFLLALQFLTVIPFKVKQIDARKMAGSLVYFPLVGLLLGLILYGISNILCILNFTEFSANIVLVVSLITLTGAIHLDGLSDTFDALSSGKDRDEMLRIMRDPHTGAMGVISIISVILLKLAFLSSIGPALKPAALIMMCVLSRWSLVSTIFLFPYARDEGKAKIFKQGANFKLFILATMTTLAYVLFISRLRGLLVFTTIAGCGYIIARIINKKISGFTGDTLGAISELTEVLVLFGISILKIAV